MKKLIALFLLLTFCTLQVNCAENPKDTLNKVTITDSAGNTENIYFDEKGSVKKTEEIVSENPVQKFAADPKEQEHQQCIKDVKKVLTSEDDVIGKFNNYVFDYSKKSGKEYMKLKLLDGDYAIAYKDSPYIGEYHKDKSMMGVIKADKKILNDERASVIFYEYRMIYNESNNTDEFVLKHILFLDYEKDKYITQYIYNADGKLLCRQINNEIYIDSSARNMLPKWSKRKIKKGAVYNAAKEERNEMIKQGLIYTAAAPFMIPAYAVFGAMMIAALPIGLPMVWYLKKAMF